MVTIINNTKAVKVLKAVGMKPLRLFPGYNNVKLDKEEILGYATSAAAKAVIKESLTFVAEDVVLTGDEKAQAEASRLKNEELNKAYKVIEQQNKKIMDAENKGDEMAQLVKEQAKSIAEMKKQIKSLEKGSKKEKS